MKEWGQGILDGLSEKRSIWEVDWLTNICLGGVIFQCYVGFIVNFGGRNGETGVQSQ